MAKREKILIAVVASLLVMLVLWYGYGLVSGWFDERDAKIAGLKADLDQLDRAQRQGQRSRKRLAGYEARSLPSDREMARSLYQNFLSALIERSGLAGGVTSQSAQSQRGVFDRLAFTVNAGGSLTQVVSFLHGFYSANHMQHVRLLTLKPVDGGKKYDLVLMVEAAALPGSSNTTQLAGGVRKLEHGDAASYAKKLSERNLFVAYVAPKPPAPPAQVVVAPAPPAFDPAKHTIISAILIEDGARQVWLNDRTAGSVLRLNEGGKFDIGAVHGAVSRINARDIELTIDGKLFRLALGELLSNRVPVDAASPGAGEDSL